MFPLASFKVSLNAELSKDMHRQLSEAVEPALAWGKAPTDSLDLGARS